MRNFFGLARVWVRVRVRPVRVRVRPIRIRVRPIRVRVRPIRIRARPIRVRVKSRVRRPQDLFPREGRIGPGSGDPLLGIHSLCSGGRGSRVVPPELEALFFHPGFCPVSLLLFVDAFVRLIRHKKESFCSRTTKPWLYVRVTRRLPCARARRHLLHIHMHKLPSCRGQI